MTAPDFKVSLAAISDLVAAEFVDRGCPAPVLYGEQHVQEHSAANRVIFMPSARAERFLNPQQIQAVGATPQLVADWQAAGGANPRPIWTRVVACKVNVWARAPEQSAPGNQRRADEEALHALLNCVAASLWTVAHGAIQMVAGKFDTTLKDVRHGLLYALELDVFTPLVECDFPPGYISSDTRTWPMESAAASVSVEMQSPTGPAINTVTFTAATPTGTPLQGET